MKAIVLIRTGEFSYKRVRLELYEKDDHVVYVDMSGQEVDENDIIWMNSTDRDILDNVIRIAFSHITSMMGNDLILSEDSAKHLHGIMDAYLDQLYEIGEKALSKTRENILLTKKDLPHFDPYPQ